MTTTTPSALQDCLARHREQAVLALALDEALGTLHGMAWADLVLLDLLDASPDGWPEATVAARLGLPRSRLLLRVRPLEKLGWVERRPAAGVPATAGGRRVALRPAARARLREARETAGAICDTAARRASAARATGDAGRSTG